MLTVAKEKKAFDKIIMVCSRTEFGHPILPEMSSFVVAWKELERIESLCRWRLSFHSKAVYPFKAKAQYPRLCFASRCRARASCASVAVA